MVVLHALHFTLVHYLHVLEPAIWAPQNDRAWPKRIDKTKHDWNESIYLHSIVALIVFGVCQGTLSFDQQTILSSPLLTVCI